MRVGFVSLLRLIVVLVVGWGSVNDGVGVLRVSMLDLMVMLFRVWLWFSLVEFWLLLLDGCYCCV